MTQNDIVAAMQTLFPALQVGIDYTTNNNNGDGSIALWNNANGAPPTIEQLQSTLDGLQLVGYKTMQNGVVNDSFQNATYNLPIAYMGTTFWKDQNSQFMLLGAAWGYAKAGAVPDGFAWWDSNSTPVPMALEQLEGLALATLASVNDNFVKRKQLLASIAAATTIAEVQAVIW